MRKAYALRERTSEREKLAISSFYELLITGNLESARTRLELWAQTYPRDDQPQTWLWLLYVQLGALENSLRAGQEAVKLDPGSANNYVNLVYAYLWVNRLDEAKATAQEGKAHNVYSPWTPLVLYVIDFLQHDVAGAEREAAAEMGKPSRRMGKTLRHSRRLHSDWRAIPHEPGNWRRSSANAFLKIRLSSSITCR